jgi:hypothetical protein
MYIYIFTCYFVWHLFLTDAYNKIENGVPSGVVFRTHEGVLALKSHEVLRYRRKCDIIYVYKNL